MITNSTSFSLSNKEQNVLFLLTGKVIPQTHVCVCVYTCVCVCFWKCYHGFLVLGFRFDLCFYRDPLAAEIVQLMTETDRINTSNSNSTTGTNQMIPTRDSDSTSSDILMPGGINWNEWLQILRQKYEENMRNQKQHQQESIPVPTPKKPKKTPTQTEEVEKTSGPMRRSQIANKDTTLEEDTTLLIDIDHDEHSQRI